MITNLTNFFDQQGWLYNKGHLEGVYFLSLGGYYGNYNCTAEISEEQQRFVFLTFLGLRCPQEKIKDMAELLTKINSNLAYGNFEINYPIGDIKFRTGIHYEDTKLSDKLIANVVFRNINTLDLSNKLLSKFMVGDASIEDVYDGLYNPKALPNTIPESEK